MKRFIFVMTILTIFSLPVKAEYYAGYDDGYEEGYEEGFEEGYEEGYDKGKEEICDEIYYYNEDSRPLWRRIC